MGWNEDVRQWAKDGSGLVEQTRQGGVFNASARFTSVAGSAIRYSAFITGSLPVFFYERDIGRTGSGVSATIFRNGTYTGGTSVSVFNTNDLNPSDTTVQLFTGVTLVSIGEQTTSTSYAIGNTTGSGQGGLATLGSPLYMKPNTVYLLRITNLDTSASDISASISWYEGYL